MAVRNDRPRLTLPHAVAVAAAPAIVLLALAPHPGCEKPSPPSAVSTVEHVVAAPPPVPPDPWFTDITDAADLDFRHTTGSSGRFALPEIMGSGAALFDADNDGDLDIYLTNGPAATASADRPRETPVNRFFRRGPDGRYADDTPASGLGDPGDGMGVAVGDLDNDGDLDLYLANHGSDQLFRNDGAGRFVNITASAGVDVRGWSSSAAFVDFDRDGWLDLYVTRYVEFDPDRACRDSAGRPDYCGPKSFPGVRDVLLRNRGNPDQPAFEDVSIAAGLDTVPPAAGLGLVCADLDRDGWIDIFVANDGHPNHLWLNRGDGTFLEAGMSRGVAVNLNGQTEAGMGVVAADLDHDDDLDLFLSHQARETNTLYRHDRAGGDFVDATGLFGLATSSVPYTGFGLAAMDLELDGDLDLVIVGGRVIRGQPKPSARVEAPWDRYAEPNLLYLGDGFGRFVLEPARGGPLVSDVDISRGLAVGDIDDDGDLDVLVSNIEGRARLYRNDAPRSGSWLIVRALDPALRRDALGAQVRVIVGTRRWLGTIASACSYQSASDPRAHFGLGDVGAIDGVEILWPDGTLERFPGTTANRVIVLRRGEGVTGP